MTASMVSPDWLKTKRQVTDLSGSVGYWMHKNKVSMHKTSCPLYLTFAKPHMYTHASIGACSQRYTVSFRVHN